MMYGNLQRALFVFNMHRHKKRAKTMTLMRMEMEIVDECRRIVRKYDEAQQWQTFALKPGLTLHSTRPPFTITGV